jgi:hypothetical protein
MPTPSHIHVKNASKKQSRANDRFLFSHIYSQLAPSTPTPSTSDPLKYKHSAKESTRRNHAEEADGNLNSTSRTSTGGTRSLAVGGTGRGTRASSSSRLAGLACKVRARACETLAGTRAAGHEVRGLLGDGRKTVALDLPLVRLRGALGSRAALLEATIASGVLDLGVLRLEALEVVVGRDFAVAANLDDAVAVGLDGVLVCETARVDGRHVRVVQGVDLAPLALVGNAAKLRQEDGLAVVLVRLDLLVPARDLERRGIAPRVVVKGKEVGALVIGAAVEVESLGLDVLSNVSSRVSNGNNTTLAVSDVLLHVTGDSLDIRSGVGVVLCVDDLVTREEEEQVVVVGEGINGSKDVLEVSVVVRSVQRLLVLTVKRVLGRVGIESKVDTRIIEHLHALVVVLRVVDGVDADGVNAERLEVGDIALQALEIQQRVLCISGTTWVPLACVRFVSRRRHHEPGW